MRQILPIACAVDHRYLLPLAVAMASLRQQVTRYEPVLYLLHTGLSRESIQALRTIIETHAIQPSSEQLALSLSDARFPREASLPLLLDEVLPADTPRVLFLDADILVLNDLAPLWETPLDHAVLGAVADAAIPRCSSPRGVKGWRALGIPSSAPYFNGGVLLLDLVQWRQREVRRRVQHYLATAPGPVDFLHQEALNAALAHQWLPLDERWNLQPRRAARWVHHHAGEQPGVVHFAGRSKPWRAPVAGPFYAAYRGFLHQVAHLFPPSRSTFRDRAISAYDRYLRPPLHPLERSLWKLRLL
jgi:UDP-D-galactose:(glucosyl)LPS alpha-1,3-D-galactosyltransferase